MKGFALGVLISAAVLAGTQVNTPIDKTSTAYRLGWIDGRMEGFVENLGIERFHNCLKDPKQSPEACWQAQIAAAQQSYADWDKATDEQKLRLEANPQTKRWINILRGKGDPTDLPRFIR